MDLVTFAQAAAPMTPNMLDWSQFALQGGFAGIVCWMVLHYTRVVIPKLVSDQKAEREAMLISHREERGEFRTALRLVVDDCAKSRVEERELHVKELARNDVLREAAVATVVTAIERAVERSVRASSTPNG